MGKIRSEHARAILYPPLDIREAMKSTSRSNTYMASAFGRLHDESDLDSLSALLIFQRLLTRKDKHDIEVAEYFSDQIMKIIIRCFAQVPFFYASGDLLNYVVRHFLELTNKHTWSQALKNGEVGVLIGLNRILLDIVDELEILERYPRAPASCLHIVRRHISSDVMMTICDPDFESDSETAKRLPEIQELTRELIEWESHRFQSIP